MKRYRILNIDFDSRAILLSQKIGDHWEEQVKNLYRENKEKTSAGLIEEFGEFRFEDKLKNFLDLGPKPFSIIAFHNKFFEQCRRAFIVEAYYSALTGACALGERILNHLILALRDDFKSTPEYKHVYRNESFDDWNRAITTLETWNVLLLSTAKKFRELADVRHREALHFNSEIESNDREIALKALKLLESIILNQFAAWGSLPWIFIIPGQAYIKRQYELDPFVRKVYLPNCVYVGPFHKVKEITPEGHWIIQDQEYEDREITDEEFSRLQTQGKI